MSAHNISNITPHLHCSISHTIDYYIHSAAQYEKAFVNSELYRDKRLKAELGIYRLGLVFCSQKRDCLNVFAERSFQIVQLVG